MEKEALLQKRLELKQQLQELDVELDKVLIQEEIEELDSLTDQLNTIFQNPTLEKHCPDEANELYVAMQRIDKKVQQLRKENEIED